jgi:hypothetical protein
MRVFVANLQRFSPLTVPFFLVCSGWVLGVPRAAAEARRGGCRATTAGTETKGAGAAWAGDGPPQHRREGNETISAVKNRVAWVVGFRINVVLTCDLYI